jgi:hypothetical protein
LQSVQVEKIGRNAASLGRSPWLPRHGLSAAGLLNS